MLEVDEIFTTIWLSRSSGSRLGDDLSPILGLFFVNCSSICSYSAPSTGSECCNEHVCVSVYVCLSLSMSVEPRFQTLPNFLCMLPVSMVWSSYSDVAICYTGYTSGFVNDVMFSLFSIMGLWRGQYKWVTREKYHNKNSNWLSSGGMLAWISVWGEVQICMWPSRCHCHSLSLAPVSPDWFYLPDTSSPWLSRT